MQFSLHKWKNSFPHAFSVTNDLNTADFVHADFFPDLKNVWVKDQGLHEKLEIIVWNEEKKSSSWATILELNW